MFIKPEATETKKWFFDDFCLFNRYNYSELNYTINLLLIKNNVMFFRFSQISHVVSNLFM